MSYLRIIRPLNLLLLVVVQCLLKYGLFAAFEVYTAMNGFQFLLLLTATVAIAAAGNVINDIYDLPIDIINKPKKIIVGKAISEKQAFTYFIILNIVGVLSGFLLANQLGKPGLAGIFIAISALLYMYATQIKAMLLVGNLLISVLVAFSILIVVVFDFYPLTVVGLTTTQKEVSGIVLHYAIFAFAINLIREIVKDLEDINGDKNGGINTLAIALGRSRAAMIVFVLAAILTCSIALYLYIYLYDTQLLSIYFLLLVVSPLLYFCIQAWSAESKNDFHRLSQLLKLIMFTGMCSLICYKFL